ncbi:hypothetical protein [Calothrix rhizosoleniae]|uniref:hypothetical protein n=1 Tax=Calothrix rhizosoleniae TaxID=888997 RepID=UPI000B4A207F|nr:hypothetical protein [Calothrix rhizosoleniae]
MECINGKTQEITGRLHSSHGDDQRERLASLQSTSRINGTQQVRPDKEDCSRDNTFRATSNPGKANDGKILERLEFIEKAYLNYVQSHQQRLEARYSESKEQEVVFKEAIQALKAEILDLASHNE